MASLAQLSLAMATWSCSFVNTKVSPSFKLHVLRPSFSTVRVGISFVSVHARSSVRIYIIAILDLDKDVDSSTSTIESPPLGSPEVSIPRVPALIFTSKVLETTITETGILRMADEF